MISAVAMTVMLVAALGCFSWLIIPRLKLVLRAPGEARFDNPVQRVKNVFKFAIGQWRMPREPIAGFAHIFIFSGFMVVALGTVLHIVHAYLPEMVDAFYLETTVGKVYGFIKDIFEYLVLVGVTYGLWRRLKPNVSRVGRSAEGVFVLFMIFTLMVTDFLSFGATLIAHNVQDTSWYPGAALGKLILEPMGDDAAATVGEVSYWIHCFSVLLFLNFLPLGKHFHVITGIPNVFFRDLKPYGQVPKMVIDLEDEDPKFGMRSAGDVEWKMVMDVYSCTECGRCTTYCPTHLTDKPLTHRGLNLDIKKSLYENKEVILSGDEEKLAGMEDLVGGNINPDTIWACTTCGSCEQECPVFIENIGRIIQMRQHKVMMEGDITPELQRAYQGMENNNNPWNVGFDQRDAWAEGLDIVRMSDWISDAEASKDNPPLLYWVGCAGSFDDRTKKVTLAMVQILKAANVPFAILGKEEGCTGDAARRTGNEYLFQALAEANIEILNNYGVKNILTTCPHCLHTIKREYPQFDGNFEVVHHTQMIDQLIQEGKIKLKDLGEGTETIALHDSCYLGRYHDIYDAPRNIVNAVPDAQLIELPRNKSRSVCCGAGGGRFWMEEDIGERINVHRSKEIAEMNTKSVGANCPFCLTMISDGMKDEAVGKGDVPVRDLAEIVASRLDV